MTYIVDPRSVLEVYHKFVQNDPSHKVYKITLATKPEQIWVLDPCSPRMGYDEMLLPWNAFRLWRAPDTKHAIPIKPDIYKFELLMGICHHEPIFRPRKDGGRPQESFERRSLRTWLSCWSDLIPEIFGGSMFNLGTLNHAEFAMAMDEFLATFGAYVETYLLDTAYYVGLMRNHATALSWANAMYDGHPEPGQEICSCSSSENEGHENACGRCSEACDCKCHGTPKQGCYDLNTFTRLNRLVHEMERAGGARWDIRSRIEERTERKIEELTKEELLKTVQLVLVDRAGVRLSVDPRLPPLG